MKKTLRVRLLTLFFAALAALSLGAQEPTALSGPPGFRPPPLHPSGVALVTQELGPGVYALLADRPGVDNSGFIVGERGVLVVDAHINAEMAGQIQAAVRRVTSKPILYLVNTNYHGDHTFGNYAFPAETRIVAHWKTAERMREFDHEKEFLLGTVNGDRSVYGEAELRLPDLTFDDYLRLDLGGRYVELYHFGPGNTAGDTVVYEPLTRTAWTGNFILGNGTIPFLIEGRPGDYLESVARFARTLPVETIIPGHAAPARAEIFGRYLSYLNDLLISTREAKRSGQTLEAALRNAGFIDRYVPAPDPADATPLAQVLGLMRGFHLWNVQKAYSELGGSEPASSRAAAQ